MFKNKDENVHRFALSALGGELLEKEHDRKHDGQKSKPTEFQRFSNANLIRQTNKLPRTQSTNYLYYRTSKPK